ncbi:MAG TPA: MoxR family ATPase [Terriglobia bacterium]|nr:MoxR family ATPase [Terriglobia bacterium]
MKMIETSTLERISALHQAMAQAVKGKDQTIALAIIALIAEGHLLIEDVPGVGKTTLGHALARAIDCAFHRIQFTSDLLPSDVLGVSVFNPKLGVFEFKPGPIFANIVLADEINRTTPKTQSALLEAMNEAQVTIENDTYNLPRPFMVLATQNPVEHHGTYPLPESQLDRFLMKIEIGYPDLSAEREILRKQTNGSSRSRIEPALTPDDVLFLQAESRRVRIDDSILDYILTLVSKTRQHPEVEVGVSPRGSVALSRSVQAAALAEGRMFVVPDDVKRLAAPVFTHRLLMKRSGGRAQGEPRRVVEDILRQVPVPA